VTREEEIFEQALDFESDDERRAYLAGACGGDKGLAEAVAELLAASGEADRDDFLPSDLGNEALVREGEGSVIGRYKLLQKIGEGGFGVVYMAEQREPVKRRVALKIIKLGMDTKHVVGRFEAERQALAMMEHPNIANVLDAGATEHGRPYFVMELVRGVPVTQFCDEKQLSTEQRLTLFLDICSAVQHAHQKGIIHRDLKPNNVLVTVGDDGNRAHPKVIDFGIAKATQQELTDKTLFTRFEDFVGTPAYMSPEQAQYSQLDIDTRTDIYSLGVLLYELLAGRTPFDSEDLVSSGVDEIRRRIREEEPPRPSTRLHSLEHSDRTAIAKARGADPELLRKKLRNEIDWIIMKAIDKDRSRRYGTAEALADDIGNYLSDAPVEACPPTASYRFKKMVRHNKGAFAVTAAVVGALALGAIASAWQAVQTSRANDRGRELLRDSYLVQANATRRTIEPGRHYDSLSALKKAAAIAPSLEQRSAAIAALAMPDLRYTRPLDVGVPGLPRAIGVIDADGERYAIGNPQGEVKVYRYDDRTEIASLPAQDGRIIELRFSPNGKYLAVQFEKSGVSSLNIWDFDKGQSVLSVAATNWQAFDFSGDSSRIAIGLKKDRSIVVHDLTTGERVGDIDYGRVPRKVRFDPAGERIAAIAGTPEVAIFDVVTGSLIKKLTHLRNAMSIAWHPEGETLAMGAAGFSIVIYDVALGLPVELLRGHQAEVVALEFHPSGRFLASDSWDGTTRVWEHYSGRCVLQTLGNFAGFLRDGSGLKMALDSRNPGIWEFTTGSDSISSFHLKGLSKHKVVSLSFAPNSQWLAGSAQAVSIWDLGTRSRILAADVPSLRSVIFESNGRNLLVGGPSTGVRRLQIGTGVEDGKLEFVEQSQVFEGIPGGRGKVNHIALSPDQHTIAAGIENSRALYLLDAATGLQRARLVGQPGRSGIRFGPGGRWLASGCWQGSGARVWDLNDLDALPIDLCQGEDVVGVAFDRDGEHLITRTRGTVQFWRVGSWEKGRSIETKVSGITAFHPSEPLMAVCRGNAQVSLLHTETHAVLAELEALNPGSPTELTFSPDGTQLAMATSVRDITVWNLPMLRKELAAMGLDWDQ